MMTDFELTQPVLTEDFLDNVTVSQKDIVDRTTWTDLRTVKLGAYAPDGVFRIKVPTVYRRFRAEMYFSELDDSGMGTCINTKTNAYKDLKVKIGHPPDDKDRWHVQDVVIETEINPVSTQPGVALHGNYHELRGVGHNGNQTTGQVGSDVVFIDDRQMWQGGILPYSGWQARILPVWLNYDGEKQYWNGTTITDQTANVPAGAGNAAWVLVERDAAGTMTYTKGTEFAWATTNSQTDYVPQGSDNTAQWAVLVRNGDTEFTYGHLWNLSMARHIQGKTRTAISADANTSGRGIYEIDTSGVAITLTLDTDDVVDGREIIVKDTAGNANASNITIDTEGAETIDGAGSQTINTDYGYLRLYSDGSNWFIIG